MMEELEHLKQGSSYPPMKKGSLRIYNMRFCPYAQRSLLVAEAKGIPYDIINVNLTHKPDWFLKLNPRGKVPTLEFEDGSTLPESLITCDYLDEQYPNIRPLYPKNPFLKAKDHLLIDRFNEVITQIYKILYSFGKPDRDVSPFDNMLEKLDVYEKDLTSRGTTFFGGTLPGMVDYMIWPWFERVGVMSHLGGESLDIFNERFASLKQWHTSMINDPSVKKWYLSPETHAHYLMSRISQNPDYDYLVGKAKY